MPLRTSVGSTNAHNRVLDASVCRTEARKALLSPCGFHYHSDWPVP